MRRRQLGWVIATGALVTVGVAAGLKLWADERRADQTLEARVTSIQPAPEGAASCDAWLAGRMPLVLVAMGQSNAGNHGDRPSRGGPRPPIPVLHQGRCVMAQEPLPGGTGSGASLWSALHQRLNGIWAGKPVVWLIIGVESTRLGDWTDARSPLRRVWEQEVDAAVATGWPIAGVLWQQGEADALGGTSTEDYLRGLRELRALTEARGLPGPWWLARSTWCPPGAQERERGAIRAAVQDLVDEPTNGFRAGPDTDTLTGPMRNGCHFSAEGVEAAAALWQQALEAKPAAEAGPP